MSFIRVLMWCRLGVISLGLLSPLHGAAEPGKLFVKAGSTGYLGTITPKKSYLLSESTPTYISYQGAYHTLSIRSDTRESISLDPAFAKAPDKENYGLKMDKSTGAERFSYVVLLINGQVSANFKTKPGTMVASSARLADSVFMSTTEASVSPHSPLSLDFRPKNEELTYDPNYAFPISISLSPFTVYAPYSLSPGKYRFMYGGYRLERMHGFFPYKGNISLPFLKSDDLEIIALKSCEITASSPTQLSFNNQKAKTYETPTLLDSVIASVNVNCPFSGTPHVTLKSYQPLVSGSQTGMEMSPKNPIAADAKRPYIVTTVATTAANNALCVPNASTAITYNEPYPLPKSASSSFNEQFMFHLCATGKIASGEYESSVDVSMFIE